MVEYLLDTNHASRLMGQDPQILSHLQRTKRAVTLLVCR